jgi:hypothetical protein
MKEEVENTTNIKIGDVYAIRKEDDYFEKAVVLEIGRESEFYHTNSIDTVVLCSYTIDKEINEECYDIYVIETAPLIMRKIT